MRKRRSLLFLATIGLIAAGLAPANNASAQSAEIVLSSGPWEGTILVSGAYVRQGNGDLSVAIIDHSTIGLQATVGANGQITSGTMDVDIGWTLGTNVTSIHPANIASEHRQYGTLSLSGTAGNLVAGGTVTWATQVWDSNGNFLEEVSGEKPTEVEWTFAASGHECGVVVGTIVDAKGLGIMVSAAIPSQTTAEDVVTNDLTTVFHMWPKSGVVDVAELAKTVAIMQELAHSLLTSDEPLDALSVLVMVNSVLTIREQIIELQLCDLIPDDFLADESGQGWLEEILQIILGRVLQEPEAFTAQDLISLLVTSASHGAVGPGAPGSANQLLYDGFESALDSALDQAVSNSDFETIIDIAVAAANFGYTNLYDKAVAAHGGGQ
ncbi:MAG: hypothetical protein GY708_18800 [Actinomycetia bacterium]|nr:hypothetical protein [Actinomycetes bacterium]MCP4961766.1 hypothetical protein [Actinomycetes bacterium]